MVIDNSRKQTLAAYARDIGKWLLVAVITGTIGGPVGALFHHAIDFGNTLFNAHTWLIWLLPPGGIIIAGLYTLSHMTESGGTDQVIDSVRSGERLPLRMASLIFLCTAITHLFGGSAGREGAALQLGGSIGTQVGRILRLSTQDMHIVTLCGMSALFSALFCTPLTAVFFALEVVSVGVMYYAALLPCMGSALLGYVIAVALGGAPIRFSITLPTLSFDTLWRTVILAAACAAVSVAFCLTMKHTGRLFKKAFPNLMLRAAVGGTAIILLTYICGSNDFNGSGMDSVFRAVNEGVATPMAWAWKIVFTAITIGCGFKGGEIVPTLFIGSTFGCFVGGLLGMNPGLGAAIGMIAVFCAVVNCPVASILLSVELFGANALLLFAPACIISYVLSGNYGLYHAQKIMYSKVRAVRIDKNAH